MNFCHRYNHILDNQDGFAADALDRVVKLDRIVAPLHLNRAPMKILPALPNVGVHALQVVPNVVAHCPEGVGVQLQDFFYLRVVSVNSKTRMQSGNEFSIAGSSVSNSGTSRKPVDGKASVKSCVDENQLECEAVTWL